MDRRRVGQGLVLAGALAVAVLLLAGSLTNAYDGIDDRTDGFEYDRTTVSIESAAGEALADIEVRIADTQDKRDLGLSDTDHLGPREGMLFVHESDGPHIYVMREMAFPLDIVFVTADGTITEIHQAPVPEDTWENRYRGRGRYVLEVNRGTMAEINASEGDRVVVPDLTEG